VPIKVKENQKKLVDLHCKAWTMLMLNVHITHHDGTSICHEIGQSPDALGETPYTFCISAKIPYNNITAAEIDALPQGTPLGNPWTVNETAHSIKSFRKRFHMFSREFKSPQKVTLQQADLENEDLFSVIVLREPLSRLMAGDG
jgi:hypothetical protein